MVADLDVNIVGKSFGLVFSQFANSDVGQMASECLILLMLYKLNEMFVLFLFGASLYAIQNAAWILYFIYRVVGYVALYLFRHGQKI